MGRYNRDVANVDAPDPRSELERMACLTGSSIERRLGEPLRDHWLARAALHAHDSYAGIPLVKFPEDLRVYEHILWADRPSVVIEIGTHRGGSALWFRDRLRALLAYGLISDCLVITVDIEADRARPYLDSADRCWEESITLVTGDVCDEALASEIRALLPASARCLVVEDSAHTYTTTMAALTGFSQFVPPGGFFIVEDSCVDIEAMRLQENWPRGVLAAVADWLDGAGGSDFTARRDLELYGMTCHPGGFLQREVIQG
jgi:cephalosporin hydroxylase